MELASCGKKNHTMNCSFLCLSWILSSLLCSFYHFLYFFSYYFMLSTIYLMVWIIGLGKILSSVMMLSRHSVPRQRGTKYKYYFVLNWNNPLCAGWLGGPKFWFLITHHPIPFKVNICYYMVFKILKLWMTCKLA